MATKQQQREQLQRERDQEASFQHTQLGVYLAGAFGLMYLWASSAQSIVDKYHVSKRWFYLYGALCFFAYLYMRPFVRRGLGSAGRGYLNFGSLYICWLCSAVFCHLPSFEALGIDIKADVSLGLSIAASSFLVLGVMHGIQQLLIHFKCLTPAPGATQKAVWTCVLLNTLTLALTCSTYFQLCGNGGARQGLQDSSFLQKAVCMNWLAPIPTQEYPNFSAWMLYGERTDDAGLTHVAAARAPAPSMRSAHAKPPGPSIFNVTYWWGAAGAAPPPPPPQEEAFGLGGAFNASQLAELVSTVNGPGSGAGSVISPVFTMWITLVALYIVNVLADHVAANNMSARHISELRRDLVPDPDIALLAQLSTAAGITLRENAHQWAAAQQQRQEEARKGQARRRPAQTAERLGRGSKKHGGIKRSKSLESHPNHPPLKKPWSPRFVMERTLVNLLETTSSFSFKAAALLEGKPFTWQEQHGSISHPGALGDGCTGTRAAFPEASAGATGKARSRTSQQQQHAWQRRSHHGAPQAKHGSISQRRGLSDSVGSLSPASLVAPAADGDSRPASRASGQPAARKSKEAAAAPKQQQQQRQQAGSDQCIGDGTMQPEPSFASALPQTLTAAAAGGDSCHASSCNTSAAHRPRGVLHQRSRSLSSIQSGDAASMHEDDDYFAADMRQQQHNHYNTRHNQQPQQQQQEQLSVPSMPPVTSPFARVVHGGPGALDRCGFGSTISLHMSSPPSSHRWKQQQPQQPQQQQQQQQGMHHAHAAADTSSTNSRGQGLSSAGSPATATPASTAATPELPTAGAADVAAQPPFLDMVPWYSGTSADLFKTMFDLLISVKLFLGRFDMRTMQAATAASMAEHPAHSMPQEGDGFTYEHFADRQELWFDFIADTGDGGNPTYAVARALAAPEVFVPVPDGSSSTDGSTSPNKSYYATSDSRGGQGQQQTAGGRSSSRRGRGSSIMEDARASRACRGGELKLPRGEVLLIGGDLAYPNPSRETFEQRLFVPFQEAMPPPPHYHPGRLVVHKPDLPPAYGPPAPPTRLGGPGLPVGLSPRASRSASVAALREYPGPNAFAIPGNHDWIDGLETFIQQIQHKGWLGGWLLPQEKSYFALRLPAGWWVFGLDLALVGDIDMCQYRYFANLIEQRLGPNDNVIIITHEPTWLLEWFWASSSSSNLRQLVRGHLRGRARVHLAGDLHFYMRHSYCSSSGKGGSGDAAGVAQQNEASLAAGAAAAAAAGQQTQQQQEHTAGSAGAPVSVGAHGGVRRLSSDSGVSCRSNSVSSSSGFDSCPSDSDAADARGIAAAAAAAAAAKLHSSPANAAQQQLQQGELALQTAPGAGSGSSRGQRSRISNSSSHSGSSSSTAGGSPVQRACQTLPRLQLGRSSFEGLEADGPYAVQHHPQQQQQQQQQESLTKHQGMAASGGGKAEQHTGSSTNSAVQQYLPLDQGQQQRKTKRLQQQQQQQQQPTGGCGLPSDPLMPAHVRADIQQQRLQQQHTFLDPEHLICNGMGGAFLHPTHVFSYSRFAVLDDEAATATAAIYSSSEPHRAAASGGPWHPDGLSWHCPMSPSGCSDLWDLQSPIAEEPAGPAADAGDGSAGSGAGSVAALAGGASVAGPTAPQGGGSTTMQQQQQQQQGGVDASAGSSGGAPGVYKCAALFPSASTSLKLGRNNLHLFRFKNSRFDVIGGAIYFLSIVSILPRCNAGLALLASTSLWDFAAVFLHEFAACWYALFMDSYLSLGMACAFFLLCLGFAKGGGVGAVSGERQVQQQQQAQKTRSQQKRAQQAGGAQGAAGAGAGGRSSSSGKLKRRSPVVGPLVRLRTGGASNQLLVAMLHTGAHLSLAIVLLLLLELGVEVCIKYESLGNDGMGSMYRWFEAYQDQHFPDPMGLRTMAHKWSLGLYPGIIKAAMAVYDIPEAIAVVRNAVCSAPTTAAGFASLSRLQVLAYYGGMLAYYWLLAIPAMGFVFGLYLYISVCWFHVHYDEAFSALRIANYKGVSRLHITPDGDLEIFTLGMDRVPMSWREDPRWARPDGGGGGCVPAHAAAYPSRWLPADPVEPGGSWSAWEMDGVGPWGGSKQRGRASLDEAGVPVGPGGMGLRLVDYVKVPRIRPQL